MSPSSIQLSRGDVVLIAFPFTDLTGTKRRPAVFISRTVWSADGHFVFIGSQAPPQGVPSIAIHSGSAEAVSMGLRFPTGSMQVFLQPTKIATLAVQLVTRKIGTAPASVVTRLDAALRAALGL